MGFRKKQVPVVSKFPLFWSTDSLVGEKKQMIQVRRKYELECEETKEKLSVMTGRGDKQPREGNESLKMLEQS